MLHWEFASVYVPRTVCTYQKHLNVDIPDPFKGKLTARPSGKFCIPIPIAKFLEKTTQTHT